MRRLLTRTTHVDPLETLTNREKDVLELMAQGLTNAIFDKLGLTGSSGLSRRVLAVVRYLGS